MFLFINYEDLGKSTIPSTGIENNFKSVEQIRARTCSQNHSIIVFMFSLSGRVQPVVYGSAKNEQGDKDRLGRHAQKHMAANVFLVSFIVLATRIIKSADKELKYYLQCVR